MLSKIHTWFTEQGNNKNNPPEHKIELATAVLFYEVMRADNKLGQQVQESLQQQLKKHFHLTENELSSLTELSQAKSDDAADYQQFTSVLNNLYDAQQKRAVLDSLWEVAFADHELSPEEEHTIRKIAELLYIPHSQFIQSKLSVKPDP